MFDLDGIQPKKTFAQIVKECYADSLELTYEIKESETLSWNGLKTDERKDLLKDVGLPSSFSKDEWTDLDYRAKERLGKMINKTTKGEYALKETIEIHDDVDSKTVAMYNKAKAKAVAAAADAKAPAGEAPGEEKKKKKEPVVATEQEVDTYKGKKPKKAKKTLIQPGNGQETIEESKNMDNERQNVNPFTAEDKLANDMTDILKDIRMADAKDAVPTEFDSLAKVVAEKHKASTNDLNSDIMDTLRTSKKVYNNAEVNAFKGLVNRELGKPS